jgi:hypothetical protein
MTTIRIGEPLAKPVIPHRKPLTFLPTKLDAAACLEVLARLDHEVDTTSIEAARQTITVDQLDDALAYEGNTLTISDRFRLKQALTEHGILSVGRPAGRRI